MHVDQHKQSVMERFPRLGEFIIRMYVSGSTVLFILYTVEPLYSGDLRTRKDCPDYCGVLASEVEVV